ncbi:MAG TPA: hypothetical protein VGB64_02155 [Actinomycetota bacterium]
MPRARMYRLALFLYPRDLRRQFGADMLQIHRDMRRDMPRVHVWMRLIHDVAISVPRAHLEEGIMARSGITAVIGIAAVIAAGSVMTGSIPVGAAMALGSIGLLAALAKGLSMTQTRSSDAIYSRRSWTWWAVLSVPLAATWIAFMTLQLIDDPKVENVFALGIGIAFAAAIAGGLALRRRGNRMGNWLVAIGAAPGLMSFWVIPLLIVSVAVVVGSLAELFGPRALEGAARGPAETAGT